MHAGAHARRLAGSTERGAVPRKPRGHRSRVIAASLSRTLPGRRAPGSHIQRQNRSARSEYGAMRFVMPRVARRLFSGGTSSFFAGSVVLLLTGVAVASGHYPDRAQNRMEGDRGFIDTKAVQQFLDQHGTWRGSDYFVYCPAFTGGHKAYIHGRTCGTAPWSGALSLRNVMVFFSRGHLAAMDFLIV